MSQKSKERLQQEFILLLTLLVGYTINIIIKNEYSWLLIPFIIAQTILLIMELIIYSKGLRELYEPKE